MNQTALRWAFAAAGSLALAAAAPAMAQSTDSELAATTLANGEQAAAIDRLESERKVAPHDPALMINLGIAYAHQGNDAKAKALFQKALRSPDPIELETADGTQTDSRRLARKALAMLARGEFRPESERLSLNN